MLADNVCNRKAGGNTEADLCEERRPRGVLLTSILIAMWRACWNKTKEERLVLFEITSGIFYNNSIYGQ